MSTKNRAELKLYFVKNAIPTQGNFADLIDSQVNLADDPLKLASGEPVGIVAAQGDQRRVLRLYAEFPAAAPDWFISLKPAQNPADPATARDGLGITDGAGVPRVFVQKNTGNVGLGTNEPTARLDVAGTTRVRGDVQVDGLVRGNRFVADNALVLSDYRSANPASNVYLQSPGNDRDAWIYRDSASASTNWGIYHRQIDSTVGDLPGDAIGFVGGASSKLQAYVSLADGSAFFAGPVAAPGGVVVEGMVPHIERDGALYRNSDGQCYLTVDDHFYIRDRGAGTWAAAFDTDAGSLELKGGLRIGGSAVLGVAETTPNFNAAIQSGFHQHPGPVGRVPDDSDGWVHMIAVRHSNPGNHHQLQIASAYSENSRLFFRKVARGDLLDATSGWNELVVARKGGSLISSGTAQPKWERDGEGISAVIVTGVAGYPSKPRYLVTLEGNNIHEAKSGPCIRSTSETGFTVFVGTAGVFDHVSAGLSAWRINWLVIGSDFVPPVQVVSGGPFPHIPALNP